MPFGAAAVIAVSPAATPVATPLALTVATDGKLLVHVNTMPGMGWLVASRAVALNDCVPPCTIVAVDGDTVTLVTSAGGVVSLSLQVPKVLAAGGFQVSLPVRASERPTGS